MDSRDTWKVLLAKLALARERLEAKDHTAALEAVGAALAIDPGFLAAHSLRQRIELDRSTSPRPIVDAQAADPLSAMDDGAQSGAAIAPAGHRRFGVILADVYAQNRAEPVRPYEEAARAPEAPIPDEPEPAPYEFSRPVQDDLVARDVFGSAADTRDPDVIELRLRDDAEDFATFARDSGAEAHTSRSTGVMPMIVGAAVLIAVILVDRPVRYPFALAIDFQNVGRNLLAHGNVLYHGHAVAAVAATSAEAAHEAVAQIKGYFIVNSSEHAELAPLIASPLAPEFDGLVAGGRPVNDVNDVSRLNPVNLESATKTAQPERDTAAAPAIRTVSVGPTARVPEPAPPTIIATPNGPVEVPAAPGSESTPAAQPLPPQATAVPASATVGDEQGVKQALQRYRSAYERLDARLARRVQPSANEAALAGEFDSLQSQLTFTTCDVSFRVPTAVATCEGTMRYTPRIGTRYSRIEPHVWTFTLRKRGADWQVDSVKATR